MVEEDLEKGDVEKEQNLDGGGYNKETPPENDVCPICFGGFELPCQTSCGHWFCSKCFLQLWRHNNDNKPCKCPMCNNMVTKLVPLSPKTLLPDIRKTLKQVIKDYFQSDERKILKNVERYNLLHDDGPLSLFQKMNLKRVENGCVGISMIFYLVMALMYILLILIMVICRFRGFHLLPKWVQLILIFAVPSALSLWMMISICVNRLTVAH